MPHRNAKLTPAGRLLIVQRLEQGWTQAQVAEAQGCPAPQSRSGCTATGSRGWRGSRRRAAPETVSSGPRCRGGGGDSQPPP
ncbi:MAG: hypothetical protein HS107_12750 [Thermoflexaceae bacterium]|nr:hypothetical protein [Thermoflexaceae bacterium]